MILDHIYLTGYIPNKSTNMIHKPDVQMIPIFRIFESPTNPRSEYDVQKIRELAISIKGKGLIHPFTVRPVGENFEAVAGNRRRRSCLLLITDAELNPDGQYTDDMLIPCIVRQLDDDEVLNIQIDENVHRKDLTPLDEAMIYSNLIKAKVPVKELATRFGKSPSYVHTRANLLKLIPLARTILKAGNMQIRVAIALSRLTKQEQKETISHQGEAWTDGEGNGKKTHIIMPKYEDVISYIKRNYYLTLADAPFDTEAKYGKLPICATCPKNTACAASLFPDSKTGTCTDLKCYSKKEELFISDKLTEYRAALEKDGQKEPVYLTNGSWISGSVEGEINQFLKSPSNKQIKILTSGEYTVKRKKTGTRLAFVIHYAQYHTNKLPYGAIRRVMLKKDAPPSKEEQQWKADDKKRRDAAKKEKALFDFKMNALVETCRAIPQIDLEEFRYLLKLRITGDASTKLLNKIIPDLWHGFLNTQVKAAAKKAYGQLKQETKPTLAEFQKTFVGTHLQKLTQVFKIIDHWKINEIGEYMVDRIPDEMLIPVFRILYLENYIHQWNTESFHDRLKHYGLDPKKLSAQHRTAEKAKAKKPATRKKAPAKKASPKKVSSK